MINYKSQRGFALAELLILAVVVVVIAVIGFKIVNKQSGLASDSSTDSSQAALPSKISSKADARKAAKALDSQPIDSQLNPNQFDASIKSLL